MDNMMIDNRKKCRVCKTIKTLEERIVHEASTHGLSIVNARYNSEQDNIKVNWEKVKELWDEHKKTGRVSAAKLFAPRPVVYWPSMKGGDKSYAK